MATSAALAVSGLEVGVAEGAPVAPPVAPVASQIVSVATLTGAKPSISPPIAIKGELFYGTAAVGGGKLWESNGTPAGTELLKTIKARSDAAPAELTNVDGHLYFEADGELWKSNGTGAGTVTVDPHVNPTVLANADGTVFFATTGGLWKSRGTERETTEVKDLKFKRTPEMVAVSGRVYFTVARAGAFEYGTTPDLWTSNGTTAGTTAVKQTHVDSVYAHYPLLYLPEDLTSVGGHLFVSASTNLVKASYTDLWEVSGASATVLEPYGEDLTDVDGSLFFFDFQEPHNCNAAAAAEGGSCAPATGFSLWNGTKPVFDFAPSVNAGGDYDDPHGYTPYVGELTNVGGTLFFAANLGGATQLWRTDGTLAGLADVGPVPPHDLTNVNGTLFFTANDGTDPTQVWESNGAAPAADGTDAGTMALTNFPATSQPPADLINVDGTLYFTANDGAAGGYGLWKLPS